MCTPETRRNSAAAQAKALLLNPDNGLDQTDLAKRLLDKP
jgi:hypothetical protein